MKILLLTLSLILLFLLLPACTAVGPTDTVAQQASTVLSKPDDKGSKEPSIDGPSPLRRYLDEWVEMGLDEEQMRTKIAEGQRDGHLQVTALTDEDAEALKTAGSSDEFIRWLRALDLAARPDVP